jgi:hypothetical protein
MNSIQNEVRPFVLTDCPLCFGCGVLELTVDTCPEPRHTPLELTYQSCHALGCPRGCRNRRSGGHLWSGNIHRTTLLKDYTHNWVARIDNGILDDIKLLWENDIPTWVACEGRSPVDRYIGLVGMDVKNIDRARELLPWVNGVHVRPDVGDTLLTVTRR